VALVGEAVRVLPDFAEVRTLVEYFGTAEEAHTRAASGLKALAARLVSDRRGR
jgi:hypothetical protein